MELKQLAFEQRKWMVLLTAASLAKGAAMVGQALFFVLAVNGVFLEDAAFADITPYLYGLLGAILLRAFCGYAIGRAGVELSTEVKLKLRRQLISSFAADPLLASEHGQSGRKVSLLMDAVDEVDGYFSKYIPQMIQTYIIPIVLLAVIFYQHWITGLIILITAPFIPVFMALVGIRTKEKADEQMEKLGQFSGTFLDVLQGLTTLKLMGQADRQQKTIKKSSLDFRDSTMEVLKSAFLSSLMLEYISMLSMGIIALEIGLRLVVFDSLTFFTAFFVMILVPDFFNMLKDFGSAFHTGRSSAAAAGRLSEELTKKTEPVRFGNTELALQGPGLLELEELEFQYGGGFSLGPATLEIPPFSQVAFIGKSGSGKTTLLHAIAGLLPLTGGRLLVDGMDRQDISEQSWFSQMSYISQNPYLFAGSIKENIALGAGRKVADEEIMAAAKQAGIAEMVLSLKQGLDTPVGEAGRGLSGGEKQRIALARAFLKKPSLILFDEPTTGLDLKTERILQKSMAELGKGATVLTVAHRLHTIKKADMILVLDNGKLAGAGSHSELLSSEPLYREMIEAQFGGVLQ
ncbi:ATP-binding cassette subfamily C protein CydD [Planomicrobium koreense]|uniref:ATP-binding cassette subfamily C protein CydD n=1 Tax=Planococcus koreensis TaxID=112331 RepID=A0A7W8CVY7_9BACL|nr:thiol reductant ABC exporter subunit CydD [Planococcus koreensis]MBB5181473.1 ATP-binding cassette subfamily C protein CydD [Planococcus koreensis]